MINWEVVLWTCVTVSVLIGIGVIIISIISAKNIKKRTSILKDVHLKIQPGAKIMCCGGIYGKIVSVAEDTVDVEIAKNTTIKISRYSIESVL